MSGQKETVLKNTGAYTLVRIIPQLTAFLLLPVYTRLGGITTEDYGIISIANAFAALFAPVMSLRLSAAIPRYYFEHTGEELKKYLSTILYAVTAITTVFLIIILAAGPPLARLMFPKSDIPFFPYFALSLAALFFSQLSLVVERFLIAQQRGGGLLVRAIVGLPAGIGFGYWFVVVNGWGPRGALLATACTAAVMFLTALFLVRNWLELSWERRLFMPSLRYGLPLIPHAFGSYLFIYSDRVVMEKFLDLSVLGIYNIGWRFAVLLKLFVFSVHNAILPNYMQMAKELGVRQTAHRFRSIITRWSVIIGLLGLGSACFMEEVIMVMTSGEFHTAYLLVPIFVFAYLFQGLCNFAQMPILFLKKTTIIPIITLVAGAVNVGLNIVLIPVIGMYGAAAATVVAFLLTFILAHLLSRKLGPMSYDRGRLLAIFAPLVPAIGLLFVFRDQAYLFRLPMKLAVFALYAGYLWFLNLGDIQHEWRTLWNLAISVFRRRTG